MPSWSKPQHRLRGGSWPDALEACARFHAALADLPRPTWLDRRGGHFADADRAAWGESEGAAELPSRLAETITRLRALSRPVTAPGQVVHGVRDLDLLLVRALLFRLSIDGLQLTSRAPGLRWDDSQVQWDLDHAEPLVGHLEQRLRQER